MPTSAPRRLAFSALAALATTAAVAGCGSSSSGTTGGSASSSTSDGAKLLQSAFKLDLDQTKSAGYLALDLKGTVDLPQDKDIHHISGDASMTASYDKKKPGADLPPLAVTFKANGDYTDAKGKSGKGDYSGGVTYANDQLYANWEGQDYAVGEELTKEMLGEFKQELQKQGGANATSPLGGVDPNAVVKAMDLDPQTWFTNTTVTDGGQIDGEDTQKVSGPLDVKAVIDDVTTGLKALPAALPQVPGIDKLKTESTISPKDLAAVEKSVKVLNASVWVGKSDHLERQVQVELQFADESSDDDPGTGNLTLTVTNTPTPKPIVAPKTSDPITDLFLKLQKEFGGPGGPLHSMFSGGSIA